MASKCDKCEALKKLQAKYERLELKYQKLLDGDAVRKVHFDLDGAKTACGIDLFDNFVDTSENIDEVTCKNCRLSWQRMKAQWEKEEKQEKKERKKNGC